MQSDITFSIIVPVYNVESYLHTCLQSLVNQTYPNFEIILINDGSTDNSRKICEEFKNKYTNIKLIDQENNGLSAARNTGLSYATGDYILLVDSDDYIELNTLEIIVEEMREKTYDILLFQHKVEGVSDNYVHQLQLPKELSGQTCLSCCLDQTNMFIMVWKYVYSRKFLLTHSLIFHEGIIHEDEEWTIKALLLAKTVCFVDKPLYHYVRREGSIMTTRNGKSDWSYIEVAGALHTFLYQIDIEPKLKKKLKQRIFNFYYYHAREILDNEIVSNHLYLLRNATSWKEWLKGMKLKMLIQKEGRK